MSSISSPNMKIRNVRIIKKHMKNNPSKIKYQHSSKTSSVIRTSPVYYSDPVKYLGLKKCFRVIEDGEKHLERNDSLNTIFLQNMSLYMLSQMDYVIRNKSIPDPIYMGYNGTNEDILVRKLVSSFNDAEFLEERQKILQAYVETIKSPFPIYADFWESPPLRFSRRFRFKNLLFEESQSWIWKTWDSIIPDKCNLLNIFKSLGDSEYFSEPDYSNILLEDFMKSLAWESAKNPKIRGVLWIGSSANKKLSLEEVKGKEIDVVIFISGLYFKRVFANLHGIEFDVLGVPIWLAKYGINQCDPMTTDCLTHGKILLDYGDKLSILKDKAIKLWESGPREIKKYDIYENRLKIEKYLEQINLTSRAGYPNWRLIAISAMDLMIRLTVRIKRVWLKSEQDCLEMMKEIDKEGYSWLVKAMKANNATEVHQMLSNWYKRSFIKQ